MVKTIVTLFKRASLNCDLPPGLALVQEIEARFRTVFDVATRFNKSFPYVRPTLLKPEFDSARKALHLLDTLTISPDANGASRVDALDAIPVVFKGIWRIWTALEASNYITIIKVILMFEDIKASLLLVSSGVVDSETMIVSSLPAQKLAAVTLSAIDNITYHDLWAATLVIHPGLSALSFLSQEARHDVKAKGEALVRKMLQELCLHTGTDDLITSEKMCLEPITPDGSNLGASTSQLKSKMCFADTCEDKDKLSSFQRAGLTTIEKKLPRNEESLVRLWIDKANSHPILARVAVLLQFPHIM